MPEHLGIARDDLKWRQDQTYVEIFIRLPWKCRPKDAKVTITKSSISVSIGSRPAVLHGELFGSIQTSGSHWYIGESTQQTAIYMPSCRESQLLRYNDWCSVTRVCLVDDVILLPFTISAVDAILHITLMKLERRGNFYGKGRSNADTFWKSVVKKADTGNTIQLKYAPSVYYRSYCELEGQISEAASLQLQESS